jgi:hypothetical protein
VAEIDRWHKRISTERDIAMWEARKIGEGRGGREKMVGDKILGEGDGEARGGRIKYRNGRMEGLAQGSDCCRRPATVIPSRGELARRSLLHSWPS